MVKSTLGIERLFYFEQLENGLREWAKRGFSPPLSTQPQPRAVDVSAERGKRKRTEKSQVGRLFKVLQSLFFFPSFTVFPSAVPWEKTETFSAP